MPKVVTQDDIIGRFRGVHGDRYDYSKTVYNGSKQKVVVTCKEHGDFLISIANHLRGSGCKRCACDSRNSIIHDRCKKEFEAKARKLHGNKYDYSLVDYDNATTKVRIICPRHGEFLQEPSCHLNGNGCNLCALERSSISKRNCATKSFEKKAREVHGNETDNSKTKYKSTDKNYKAIGTDDLYYDIIVIDSCEYVKGFYRLAHKGNCRFCKERNENKQVNK